MEDRSQKLKMFVFQNREVDSVLRLNYGVVGFCHLKVEQFNTGIGFSMTSITLGRIIGPNDSTSLSREPGNVSLLKEILQMHTKTLR